jgi:hypothetical protein
MAFEVHEISIGMHVSGGIGLGGPSPGKGQGGGPSPADNEALVWECVRRVLQILNEKRER